MKNCNIFAPPLAVTNQSKMRERLKARRRKSDNGMELLKKWNCELEEEEEE